MINFTHWFSMISIWIAIPSLTVLGIIFYFRKRSLPRLVLASGLLMVAIGTVIQSTSSLARITFDEIGNVLSSQGPQSVWYIGSVLVSLGLNIIVLGFALVVFMEKDR